MNHAMNPKKEKLRCKKCNKAETTDYKTKIQKRKGVLTLEVSKHIYFKSSVRIRSHIICAEENVKA